MGVFDGVFGDSQSKSSSKSTSKSPTWVKEEAKNNYAALKRVVDKPYEGYEGDRVANIGGGEQAAYDAAFGGLNKPTVYGDAMDAVRKSFAGGPSSINMPTSLAAGYEAKENPYKSIQEYMDPYVQSTLDPILRQIRESYQLGENNLGAEAMGAGAYGDSRHGVESAINTRNSAQTAGDATNQVYSQAFGNAQGARMQAIAQLLGLQSTDVSNTMTAEQVNAQLQELFSGRQLAGGNALGALQGAERQGQLDWINAAAGAGQSMRANDQAGKDFEYLQYLEERGWDEQSIKTLQSALAGTPYDRPTYTTTTSQQPSSGAAGLIGAAAGALL